LFSSGPDGAIFEISLLEEVYKLLGVIEILPPSSAFMNYEKLDNTSIRQMNRINKYLNDKKIDLNDILGDKI
jgi:hypothetical protein